MSTPMILDVMVNASLSLGTYEYAGELDPTTRPEQLDSYADTNKLPRLNTPTLTEEVIVDLEYLIGHAKESVDRLYGANSLSAQSVRFREHEVTWLDDTRKMHQNPTPENRKIFQAGSEALYGRAEGYLLKCFYGYIANLRAQLGDTAEVANLGALDIVGMDELSAECSEKLPTLNTELIPILKKVVMQENTHLLESVALAKYIELVKIATAAQDVISMNLGGPLCEVPSLIEIVDDLDIEKYSRSMLVSALRISAESLMRLKGIEKPKVLVDNLMTGTAAWSTTFNAVKVKLNASKPATLKNVLRTDMHELSGHALRAANGKMLDDPALAGGTFTLAEDNITWNDYLGVEEGLNELYEDIFNPNYDPNHPADIVDVIFYTAIDAFAKGFDSEKVLLLATEVLLLEKLASGTIVKTDISTELTNRTKREAATEIAKITRMGVGELDGTVDTFNKNLTYADGYYGRAIPFWNNAYEQIIDESINIYGVKNNDYIEERIREVYIWQTMGKFDPTVKAQVESLNKALVGKGMADIVFVPRWFRA